MSGRNSKKTDKSVKGNPKKHQAGMHKDGNGSNEDKGDGIKNLEKTEISVAEVDVTTRHLTEFNLPQEVNIMKYAEIRANEIAELLEKVKKKKPKLMTQQLSFYMRRRAASHNPKRVPRRLRKYFRKQDLKKNKRPSRKHRRRPSNLLREYNRRKREYVWLETHIWFAKRFKMKELWGYKIPLHPNDKSSRAAYRATRHHALLQDLSFYVCIELQGNQGILLDSLQKLTSAETGLTFAARLYLDGSREGRTIVYHSQCYPCNAIGPVSFLWKPISSLNEQEDSTIRQLWIWIHPSAFQELKNELIFVFGLSEELQSVKMKLETENAEKRSKQVKQSVKIASEIIEKRKNKKCNKILDKNSCDESNYIQCPVYSNSSVKMVILKDKLVRHRLTGPLAQTIMACSLTPADIISKNNSSNDEAQRKDGKKWWEYYYSSEKRKCLFGQQRDIWNELKTIQSSDQLATGTVIGMLIRDPRLSLPMVRRKITSESCRESEFLPLSLQNLSSDLSSSAIWNQNIRDEVLQTKAPEKYINRLRSDLLIPGSNLNLGDEESRIPIIIIQQPGSQGYGNGWDIIIPSGWSMPFWISAVYQGARVGGLREMISFSKEAGIPLFPFNFPDTQAGRNTAISQYKQFMSKHLKYPPDKRPNFKKLGITSPFFNNWEKLINEWTNELSESQKASSKVDALNPNFPVNHALKRSLSEDKINEFESKAKLLKTDHSIRKPENSFETEANERYFVLRNKKIIRLLADTIKYFVSQRKQLTTSRNNSISEHLQLIQTPSYYNAIVYINVTLVTKGTAGQFTTICLPSEEDIRNFIKNCKCVAPKESSHKVEKLPKNKKRRKNIKKYDSKVTTDNCDSIDNLTYEELVINLNDVNIIDSCNRRIIGYVQDGAFSFCKAVGTGLGFCTLLGLLELFKLCLKYKIEPIVLVRQLHCFQYRYGKIHVKV